MSNKIDIQLIQDRLRQGDHIVNYDPPEISYMTRPIGAAIYQKYSRDYEYENIPLTGKENGRKQKMLCSLCKGTYTRTNYATHRKTKIHKMMENINSKLKKIIFDN
jgi:hypothetical protein